MAQRRVVAGVQEEIGQLLERATRVSLSAGHGGDQRRAVMKRKRAADVVSSLDASSAQSRHLRNLHLSPHSLCSSRCQHSLYKSQPQLRTYTTKTRTKSIKSSTSKSKAKAKTFASSSVLPPDLAPLSPSDHDEIFDLVSSSPIPSSSKRLSPSSSSSNSKATPARGVAEEHKEDVLRAELEGEYEAAVRYYSGSEYDFSTYPPFFPSSPGAGPSRLTSSSQTWTPRPKLSSSSKLQTPTYTLRKRRPKDKILPGPPDNSRLTLWDWRLWFSQRKGGVTRGLTGPIPPKTTETHDDVIVELRPSGKTKKKKEKVNTERQMTVRRRKHEVVDLKEGEPWFEEVEEYKKHFLPAIEAEQREDEAMLNERLSTWPLKRLKDEGYCLTGMNAFWQAKPSFGRPTAAFALGPGVDLGSEHRFENGTTVLLSRADPLKEPPLRGSVVSTTQTQIRICFQERHPEIESGVWRLDVGRPGLVFERLRNAVLGLNVDLDDVLKTEEELRSSSTSSLSPSPSTSSSLLSSSSTFTQLPAPPADSLLADPERETEDRSTWREFILHGTALRDVLLRGFRSGSVRQKANGDGDDEHHARSVEREYHSHADSVEEEDHIAASARNHLDGIDENVIDTGIDVGVGDSVQRELDEENARRRNAGIFADDQRIQSWARRYAMSPPMVMEGDMKLEGLNESQVRAVAGMVGNRVCLVQGPPGTGKTKTILHTLLLLKRHFAVPHPILVCTYTNVAVDNLVEGLASSGLSPLRVGFGPAIRPSVMEHSLHRKLEVHPRNGEVKELQAEERKVAEKVTGLEERVGRLENEVLAEASAASLLSRSTSSSSLPSSPPKPKTPTKSSTESPQARLRTLRASLLRVTKSLSLLRSKIYAIQQQMLREVVGGADVVCTTCITAATSSLGVVDFPVVFLDEASMCTEPASLVPVMKGCKHLALIGDHKQLPPVIVSKEARAVGLGVSLFERLTREGGTPSILLDTQYRMHPRISHFPAAEFYRGSVRDGTVDAETGRVKGGLEPPESVYFRAVDLGGVESDEAVNEDKEGEQEAIPSTASVIFLDHAGNEAAKDRSRVNQTEARIIASVVVDLLVRNPELRGSDIGIIAPYVAQISLLTRLFNPNSAEDTFRARLGDTRFMQLAGIEIKTVDGFEGREKAVIIFSTVRNNREGRIGFLADRRRLNVGLTRAKRALFVVGNIETLLAAKGGKGGESWARYGRYLVDAGLVVRVSEIGRN